MCVQVLLCVVDARACVSISLFHSIIRTAQCWSMCVFLYQSRRHLLECSCTVKMWNQVSSNAQRMFSVSLLVCFVFRTHCFIHTALPYIWTYIHCHAVRTVRALLCIGPKQRQQPTYTLTHTFTQTSERVSKQPTHVHTYTNTNKARPSLKSRWHIAS